jgi:transcriptional regulator with XRE-family HTH domain
MVGGLGGLIVGRRRELGLTQQELARRLGVPTANLSQLEHSTSRWQSRLLWALAEHLRLPQLEVALAARIITDLPALEDEGAAGAVDLDEMVRVHMNGSGGGGGEDGRTRLGRMLDDLAPGDAEFLAEVASQLVERRRILVAAAPQARA